MNISPTQIDALELAELSDTKIIHIKERYLRVRNHIIAQSKACHPKYLTKTSARRGLKNAGNINEIGSIHAFLCKHGVINVGVEPPLTVKRAASRKRSVARDEHASVELLSEPRRRRKPRLLADGETAVRVIEHVSPEELAARGRRNAANGATLALRPTSEELTRTERRRKKMIRLRAEKKEFELVQPSSSGSAATADTHTVVASAVAMLIMDVHAHCTSSEVIGLLGGVVDATTKQTSVCVAIPCNSKSSDTQCEMDAVSMTRANAQLERLNLQLVGWYHSHPTFVCHPSHRDIDMQATYQNVLNPFVGAILSPHHTRANQVSLQSGCQWIVVDSAATPPAVLDLPVAVHANDDLFLSLAVAQLQGLTRRYRFFAQSLRMHETWSIADSSKTMYEKMLLSIDQYPFASAQAKQTIVETIRAEFASFPEQEANKRDPQNVRLAAEIDSILFGAGT